MGKPRFLTGLPGLALMIAGLALGLEHPGLAQERTHTVTPADYASLVSIGEVAMIPAGTSCIFSLQTWDRHDDSRRSDLWKVFAGGGSRPIQLTFDRANDRKIRTARDGTVYFLGNRKRAAETSPPYDGTTQIWSIKFDGTHFRPVTRVPGGIADYDYAIDADQIVYTVHRSQTDPDPFSSLRAQHAQVEYGHGRRLVSVLKQLDLTTQRTTTLAEPQRFIRELAVTADGRQVAVVSAIDDSVLKSEGESRVDLWIDGKFLTPPMDCYRVQAASPYAWLEHLTWNHDGSRFAFVAVHDAYPAEIILGERTDSGWTTRRIDRRQAWQVVGYGRALGAPVQFTSRDQLAIATEDSGRVGLRLEPLVPDAKSPTVADLFPGKQLLAVDFHRNPQTEHCVAVVGDASHFPRLVRLNLSATPATEETTLFEPNPHVGTWKLPTVRHIRWKAPDGASIGGVLELPPGATAGQKLPLVVAIHGGPTTSTEADLNFDPHNGRLYFSTAGYAVLLPNYRGSTGYGDRFLLDLIGRENELDVQDIFSGIEQLIREGIVDPQRIAVMGWSNGGYLTNCLITRKDPPVKIRAASSGAGILDTVAEWGFNDEPAYPMVFKKGLPWEQPELYRKTSPTYGLGNVTTPTIIHVGGEDVRCPPGHSRMLYRALKEYRQVPTELIVYTGEAHGLSSLKNRQAKMDWDLAWFQQYLK